MGDSSGDAGWRWIARVSDAWTINQLVTSAAFIGILTGVWAKLENLPAPVITVLAAGATVIVVLAAVEVRRYYARAEHDAVEARKYSPVGAAAEQYAIENAKRYEAEARESAKQLEALDRRFNELQASLEEKGQSANADNEKLRRLLNDSIALFRIESQRARIAHKAIAAIQLAVDAGRAKQLPVGGLLDPWPPVSKVQGQRQTEEQLLNEVHTIINDYWRERRATGDIIADPKITTFKEIGEALLKLKAFPRQDL